MSRKKFLSIVLASLSALSCSARTRGDVVRSKNARPGIRNSSRLNDFPLEANRDTHRRTRVDSTNFRANVRSENKKFINSDTNLSYTGLSRSKEKKVICKLEEMGISKSDSESNIKKIVGILVSLGITAAVAIVLAVKYCSSSSLNWDNDTEKIIKFITWANSSCIENSYLNMFLNPIFLQEISKIPVGEWSRKNLENKEKHASEKEKEILNAKLNLIDGVGIIQEIWDDCGNHNYIGTNIQDGIRWQGFWSDFAKYSPESFGNFTSVSKDSENTKHPLLISGNLSSFKQYLSDIPGKYVINDTGYFVGGMVLYFSNNQDNGGHAIYVHLLYDNKNNIKRVIIQNPRGENNDNKLRYASQMKPNERLANLLEGKEFDVSEMQKLKVYSAMMIREDEFNKSKYWKDKSLPFNLKEHNYF